MTFKKIGAAALLTTASAAAQAAAPQLSRAGSGSFFTGIVDFMQEWVDFIAGPWAMLIVFIGLVTVVFFWIMAPKLGDVIGFGIRVVIGGFVLFNVAALLSTMMRL